MSDVCVTIEQKTPQHKHDDQCGHHQIKHGDHLGWICHDNNLHCLNENGKIEEHRLETENSPLLSDSPPQLQHGSHKCYLIGDHLYQVKDNTLEPHGKLNDLKYEKTQLDHCLAQTHEEDRQSQMYRIIIVC